MLLKFAIKDFQDDREFKNLSPVTIDGYLRTLKEFHAFCVEREIVNAEDVTSQVVPYLFSKCLFGTLNPLICKHQLVI